MQRYFEVTKLLVLCFIYLFFTRHLNIPLEKLVLSVLCFPASVVSYRSCGGLFLHIISLARNINNHVLKLL